MREASAVEYGLSSVQGKPMFVASRCGSVSELRV